jgi:putative peptidoglycan lipid II flippase
MKSLIFGGSLLAISSLISRVLGVFRDHLLARFFGASSSLDMYFAAFKIPDFVYALLVTSALSVIFLPLYEEKKQKSSGEEIRFFYEVLWSFSFILLSILGIIFIFASPLTQWYVPGFSSEEIKETVFMLRILLFSPLFFLLSSLFVSVENAKNIFWYQALSPIIYNLSLILGILFFAQSYGILAVSYAVIFGAFLQTGIHIPFVIKNIRPWSFSFLSFHDIKTFFILSLPRIATITSVQITLLFHTFLASSLQEGSISVYTYASNIQSLPYGVIAVSFSLPVFAMLSKLSAQGKRNEMKEVITESVYRIFKSFFVLFLGIFLYIPEIIHILFSYGAMQGEGVDTIISLSYLLFIALFFQVFQPLFSRMFFAMKDNWPVFYAVILSSVGNILVSLKTLPSFSVYGLALGAITGAVLYFLVLEYFGRKKQILHYSYTRILKEGSLIFSVFFPLYFLSTLLTENPFLRIAFFSGVLLIGFLFKKNMMKKFLFGSLFLPFLFLFSPAFVSADTYYHGEIQEILYEAQEKSSVSNQETLVQTLSVLLENGETKTVRHEFHDMSAFPGFSSKEKVIVLIQDDSSAMIIEKNRSFKTLFIFFGLGIISFLLLSTKVFRSFFSVILSFLFLSFGVIPQLLAGGNPFLYTTISVFVLSSIIVFVGHKISIRNSLVVLSLVFSSAVASFLGYFFLVYLRTESLHDESMMFIQMNTNHTIFLPGIFFFSCIIGMIGVLDDTALVQFSSAKELSSQNLSFQEMFRKVYRIGGTHMQSSLNTLLLAYIGASFPLFLLLHMENSVPFWVFVNTDMFLEEVLRMIIGTLGILFCIPISSVLASVWYKREEL